MARLRRDHWVLIRVAAQNVGRRRLRAVLLGVAVMLGVGIGLASFVAGWALRTGIATSLSRMGADLVVVPKETLVNITSSLLTAQPTGSSLDGGMAKSLAAIPGIARVASQRIIPSVIGGNAANLLGIGQDDDVILAVGDAGRTNRDVLIACDCLARKQVARIRKRPKKLRVGDLELRARR